MGLPVLGGVLKAASYFAALLGLAAIVWLSQRHGIAEIVGLLYRAGWPLLLLVPFHALPLLLDAMGWRVLLAPHDAPGRARLPYLFWASTIREAVARLLPLASIGGELVGIRLAMRRGLDGAAASASVVLQLLLSIFNQLLFALLSFALVLLHPGATPLAQRIGLGLLISAPVPLLAALMLRRSRLFELAQRGLTRLVGASLQARLGLDGAALDQRIRGYFAQPRILLAAVCWEFAGLVLGSFENALALRLLGHPVGLLTALSLEAAIQAARHLFFMMPAGLGVQEAGLLLIAPIFGLPPDLALALSLCKRMRDLLFGVPALLSWPWLEARNRIRA
ncbi:MAG: putative integral rane protein [Hydrocarboniphaga sp.]|uniref:lysylphosphatidylglycerol synthase domain-containing protein n=1 Tax=Hydrocarboniphaga sp. TaxID=2033016 RepID=UPI00260AD6EB|nr:lysylphosphatidylglycerol synthase domain-containing protein [Hydrocarboniphaga sp.]MDB5972599.1 putative integral rane protein [Hydrocarboniphaga sp.]